MASIYRQCIILTTPPMRTLCGKTEKDCKGITLATLARLNEINRNPEQDHITFSLCVQCREAVENVVSTADTDTDS